MNLTSQGQIVIEIRSHCMVTSKHCIFSIVLIIPHRASRPRMGDIVEISVRPSVCPCVRASERLPLYLWNAWAETNHILHMNTLGGGNGHYGDLDLICILSRSRGQRVQKNTLLALDTLLLKLEPPNVYRTYIWLWHICRVSYDLECDLDLEDR